jgi:hypothetical protein
MSVTTFQLIGEVGMVFAKERRSEEDVLVERLTERPAARSARVRTKKVSPKLKLAIARLLAEDLDLSPDDLAYRARMAVNASKGGKARAKALTSSRRRAIARNAAAVRLARRPANG